MSGNNNQKMNFVLDGQEVTVYFNFILMLKSGVCCLCGDGNVKQLYWSYVEIEEIVGPSGEALPVKGRLATIAKRKISTICKSSIPGCVAHYKEEVPAYI